MAKKTKTIEVEFEITPLDAAFAFCDFNSEDQAIFFNGVAIDTADWLRNRVFQWEKMKEYLSPEAKMLIKELAEYANAEN